MNLLHILAAFALILLAAMGLVQPMFHRRGDPELSDRMTGFGVGVGFLLGVVLFTGFFQLGSVNAPSATVLDKLGATILGGVLSLSGFYAGAKGALVPWGFYGLEAAALACYLLSLGWALAG